MGLGVVAIADPPTAIRLKVPFSDGLGGGKLYNYLQHTEGIQMVIIELE